MRPVENELSNTDIIDGNNDSKYSVRKSLKNLLKNKAFIFLMLAHPPAV